eukprot:12780074-Alexandrium_andersonii.AAC.1
MKPVKRPPLEDPPRAFLAPLLKTSNIVLSGLRSGRIPVSTPDSESARSLHRLGGPRAPGSQTTPKLISVH